MSQSAALPRVWRLIRPNAGWSLLSLLLASLSLICAIGLIATSAWLISRAWQQPPILYLSVAVVSVRAFGIGRGVFRYAERLVSHSAALRGLTSLRVALVERIAVVSPGGVSWLRPGDAVRRLVDDVDTTAEFGLRSLLPNATAALVGIVVVGFVAWLVPMAALVLLIGLLVAGVVSPFLTSRVTARSAERSPVVSGQLATDMSWTLRSAETLIACRATQIGSHAIASNDQELLKEQSRVATGMGVAAAITSLAQGLALVGVILFAVPAVTAGQLAGVNLAVVVLIPLVAFEIVAPLGSSAVSWARARGAAVRVAEVLDATNPVPDPSAGSLAAEPARTDLVMRDLTVGWNRVDPPVIDGLSLAVPAGAKIAIVGRSGVGKSTLAAALVKFLPSGGETTLGGASYRDLSGDEVRTHVLLSEQDPYIFDNTIAENVRFARPGASDDEVALALNRAQLGSWVASLPLGIHTTIGEHGSQVSGGQRQRIALARAILSTCSVVILDEPTEHLDAVTARALIDDVFASLEQRSIVLITHSDIGLDRVDSVINLDDFVA